MPNLLPEDWLIWEAFSELSGMRQEEGRIRMTEILAWMELNEISEPDLRYHFVSLITALDAAWCSNRSKKRAKEQKNARPPRSKHSR